MARSAVVTGATCADKQGDRATEHAFPIDELVAMLFAHCFTETELFGHALFTEQIFLLQSIFRLHRLHAIFHPTEVWLLALDALVERAIVHGEAGQVVIVNVTFCDNSTRFVVALFAGHLQRELKDLRLDHQLFDDLFGQNGHPIVDHNLLLATRAVKIAERDAQRRPLVLQHHHDTVGVEYVAAGHSNARLVAELARETNAT